MLSKPSNDAQEVVHRPDIEIVANLNATAEEAGDINTSNNSNGANNDADMYHDVEPSISGSGCCGSKTKNMAGLVLAFGIGAFLMAAAVGIIGAANHSNSTQIRSNAALNVAKAAKLDKYLFEFFIRAPKCPCPLRSMRLCTSSNH